MKNKSLLLSLATLLILPSCDSENDSLSIMNWEELNKEAGEQTEPTKAETRSFIGKNVLFTGNSQSTAISSVSGKSVTTTTDSSVEMIIYFLPDRTTLSNGTITTTAFYTSIEDKSEFTGQFNEIIEEPGLYEYNLDDRAETAILISFDEDNDKYITILNYKSDRLGTYEKTSDQTINGVRLLTNESGKFEILD